MKNRIDFNFFDSIQLYRILWRDGRLQLDEIDENQFRFMTLFTIVEAEKRANIESQRNQVSSIVNSYNSKQISPQKRK